MNGFTPSKFFLHEVAEERTCLFQAKLPSNVPYMMKSVRCTGKESTIFECLHVRWGQLTCEQPVHLKCKRSKFLRGNRFDKATLGVSQKFSMFLFLLLLIFYLFMFSFYSVYFWDIFSLKRKRRNRMLTPHCNLVPITITVSVLIIY